MPTPTASFIKLGPTSDWGNQFLGSLEENHKIAITPEPTVESFTSNGNRTQPKIVLVENRPKSENIFRTLSERKVEVTIVWFGKEFSKEHLHTALKAGVAAVLEDPNPTDSKVGDLLHKLATVAESKASFGTLLHSLKAVLLETESEMPRALIQEIKAAISKLSHLNNEGLFATGSAEESVQDKMLVRSNEGLTEIFQMVEALERTGVLWVKKNELQGRIDFLQGKIISAECGEVKGLKALFRMYLWDQPDFIFSRWESKEMHFGERITENLLFITTEGEKQRHQFKEIVSQLPPNHIELELESRALTPNVSLSPEEFSTLASVVEHGSVGRILDYNPLPDVTLLDSLIRLRKQKLIRLSME